MMSIARRPCRIALLGSGTVGSAVAARLTGHRFPELRLTHIFDRHLDRARAFAGDDVVCTTRIEDVLASGTDIIVEALGDLEPARTWMSYDWDRAVLHASVGPKELPSRSFLGRTTGAGNAALIVCERAGTVGLFGQGAGGDAAAGAMVSDLLAIARARHVDDACWTGLGALAAEAGETATAGAR